MFSIRTLPGCAAWIDELKDETVRSVILARIKRLELSLMEEVQPMGDGVSKLRIHLGAGWRLYFTQRGTRKNNIKRAKAPAALLDGTEEQS